MSAVTIAMIDQRLKPSASQIQLKTPVHHTIIANAQLPLAKVLSKAVTWLGNRKIDTLKICAHGVVITDPRTHAQLYTIDFCTEGITASSATAFSALKGKFKGTTLPGIELIACGSTDTAQQSSKVLIGQGIALCQAMANAAGAVVKASPDVQSVGEQTLRANPGDPTSMATEVVINPGPWEGRVWYFRPGKRGPFTHGTTGYRAASVR